MNKRASFINTYCAVDLHARLLGYVGSMRQPVVLLEELRGLAQGLTKGAFIELLGAVEKSVLEKEKSAIEKRRGKVGA